jgi:Short C-terminal domain
VGRAGVDLRHAGVRRYQLRRRLLQGWPEPYAFAWSALFLALGWNFLEYGFDPPGGGTSPGWLVCGFVFVAMGGAPLLLLFSRPAARWALWGPPREPPGSGPVPYRPPPIPVPAAAGGLMQPPPTPEPPPVLVAASSDRDVVSRLERLADLRDRGLLDANEYEIAKHRILHDEVEP